MRSWLLIAVSIATAANIGCTTYAHSDDGDSADQDPGACSVRLTGGTRMNFQGKPGARFHKGDLHMSCNDSGPNYHAKIADMTIKGYAGPGDRVHVSTSEAAGDLSVNGNDNHTYATLFDGPNDEPADCTLQVLRGPDVPTPGAEVEVEIACNTLVGLHETQPLTYSFVRFEPSVWRARISE